MKNKILQVILLFTITFTGQISGQIRINSMNNGDTRQMALFQTNDIKKLYFQEVSDPKEFINGKEYLLYYYRSNTSPLLLLGKEFNAVLFMNDRKYKNIKLQYDTYLDEVIYTDTSIMINSQFPRIALNNFIVQGFSLFMDFDSLIFKYLRFPENRGKNIPEGFYELARDGRSSLIIKHMSKQYMKQGVYEYDYNPVMYVSLGDSYRKVKNKKEFLLMFGEYSLEIKKFIKESNIRIKQAGKNDINRVLKHYESLLSSETGPR